MNVGDVRGRNAWPAYVGFVGQLGDDERAVGVIVVVMVFLANE
jgi:hypothetical protein